MNKLERVTAVLAGQQPDRPPISFWHHFPKTQWAGTAARDAHLDHLRRFDLDFLKVMNDNQYPRPSPEPLTTPADLRGLKICRGNDRPFAAELELVRRLAAELNGQVLMSVTLFNAWTTLRKLVAQPTDKHGPPTIDMADDPRDTQISQLLEADRQAVASALETVATSLANFAACCIEAGADGVFMSVRDDWVDSQRNGAGTYDDLVRKTDLQILEAAAGGRFNMLHICGRPLDFSRFADYPVHAVNWADRATGPSIADACDRARPAIAAGLDNLNTLPEGTPEQVAHEVRDALRQAKDRPIMITPGCTYDPQAVPEANLHAACAAVREIG